MAKNDDVISVDGTVLKVLPATMYNVRLESGHDAQELHPHHHR